MEGQWRLDRCRRKFRAGACGSRPVYGQPVPLSFLRRDDEARLVRRARDGTATPSRSSTGGTCGRLRVPSWSATTPRRPRTSRRRRSSPPSQPRPVRPRAPVRPVAGADRVNRAIDWVRARKPRARPSRSSTTCRPPRPASPATDAARARRAAAGRAARRGRAAVRARLHAGRDRALLDLPRGTVNSRLRRGLDALGASAGGAVVTAPGLAAPDRTRRGGGAERVVAGRARRLRGAGARAAPAPSPQGRAAAGRGRAGGGRRDAARDGGRRLPARPDRPRHAAPAVPAPLATGAPGRLLLTTGAGVWVLRGDGSGRLLGRYSVGHLVAERPVRRPSPATTSCTPSSPAPARCGGRWCARRRSATCAGRRRTASGSPTARAPTCASWTATAPRDRLLARGVGATPATWRPDTHVLAYDPGDGAVAVVDVDGGRADVARPCRGRSGRCSSARTGAPWWSRTDASWSRSTPRSGELRPLLGRTAGRNRDEPRCAGRRVAVLVPGGAVHRIAIDGSGDRAVTTVPGATTVAWSPDATDDPGARRGARPLAPPRRRHRPRPDRSTRIAERLDPDGLGSASFPAIAGWTPDPSRGGAGPA